MTKSRLSDEQVADVVIRSYLYRAILKAIRDNTVTCTEYEIKSDERYRPDLVASRVYGTVEARWLVRLLCDVEDEERPLPVARVVKFPAINFVRDRIRHFENNGGL